MFKFLKILNNYISSAYWFFKISKKINLNGFRISNVYQINNPKKIKIGKNVNIGSGAIINCQPDDLQKTLFIGDNCKIGRDVQINAYKKVQIGDNVLIADRVHISDASHNYKKNYPIIKQGAKFIGPVIIENGVWIGINAVILPNVNIGENSVIGANCVVNKNIPKNAIAIGVPAKVIKKK